MGAWCRERGAWTGRRKLNALRSELVVIMCRTVAIQKAIAEGRGTSRTLAYSANMNDFRMLGSVALPSAQLEGKELAQTWHRTDDPAGKEHSEACPARGI